MTRPVLRYHGGRDRTEKLWISPSAQRVPRLFD